MTVRIRRVKWDLSGFRPGIDEASKIESIVEGNTRDVQESPRREKGILYDSICCGNRDGGSVLMSPMPIFGSDGPLNQKAYDCPRGFRQGSASPSLFPISLPAKGRCSRSFIVLNNVGPVLICSISFDIILPQKRLCIT